MAADYSKACPHERTENSSVSGRTWCLDCGEDISLFRVHEGPSITVTKPLDTNELGPVKLDYADALADARVLNWRRIPHGVNLPMPLDKAWFAAWREMPWGRAETVWRVERVPVGGKCPALAVWWADDVLGLPPCND